MTTHCRYDDEKNCWSYAYTRAGHIITDCRICPLSSKLKIPLDRDTITGHLVGYVDDDGYQFVLNGGFTFEESLDIFTDDVMLIFGSKP